MSLGPQLPRARLCHDMIRCSHCQHDNRLKRLAGSGLTRCEACGAVLTSAMPTRLPDSGLVHARWVGIAFVLGLSAFGWAAALRQRESAALADSLKASLHEELQTAEAGLRSQTEEWTRIQTEGEAEEARRRLDPQIVSGQAAELRRDREWARRQAQDAALAVSPLEQKLVRMRALGLSEGLSDDQALLELARLAAPAGSRLEVVREGGGYLLRVAFSMAVLAPQEGGASTQHRSVASLKQEVREISARIVRELMDAGDTRGLKRLTVSCNRAIRQNLIPSAATPEERAQLLAKSKLQMRRIYRIGIDRSQVSGVADWRTVPLSRVLSLLQVEHDAFDDLVIEPLGDSELPKLDPDSPLEF